jgi:hypothetical protein
LPSRAKTTDRPATAGIITYELKGKKRCVISLVIKGVTGTTFQMVGLQDGEV